MLTQSDADYLLNLVKVLSEKRIAIPDPGDFIELNATSLVDNEKFLIDVNRKGRINVKKCTLQTRYQKSIILLRLDIEGSPHRNPDGEVINCPHLHIYREGYSDSWAFPLPSKIVTNTNDLAQVLIDFLLYNNVSNIPPVFHQLTL
jgi:hypothetical protein